MLATHQINVRSQLHVLGIHGGRPGVRSCRAAEWGWRARLDNARGEHHEIVKVEERQDIEQGDYPREALNPLFGVLGPLACACTRGCVWRMRVGAC